VTGVLYVGLGVSIAIFALGAAIEARAKLRKFGPVIARPPELPTLYPRINTDVCICSGACVSACPEGEVIAIVDGRPRLVGASACIGHGDCLRSCPVDAIELVLGTANRPVEIPVTTSAFQSSVPGLYVAGEITGMGLIHNAVAQGTLAAATALADAGMRSSDSDHQLDLAIIGAGPAGIAAALEAQRHGARYAVFEKHDLGGAIRNYPRQKIVMTAPIDLPGIGKVKLRRTSKEALLELFADIVQRAKLAIVERAEVIGIHRIGDGLRVETSAGVVTARCVVLAIGRRGVPRKLGVPGENLPHVVHTVADPAAHADKRIVVVGGGDSAVEMAVALAAQRGTRVVLVHRGPDFGRCKPDNQRALERSGVAVHLATKVRTVTTDTVELLAGDGRASSVNAELVVCCLGADLPSRWLRGQGIQLREVRGEALG
jgi:thioredoxin reductase